MAHFWQTTYQTNLKITAMKSRIATFLIAMSMFFAGTAFATTPVKKSNDASNAVAKLLKQELKYPNLERAAGTECCVLVRIIINDDGSFKVDCANCTNSSMKTHVTEAIERISKEELKKYAGQEFSYKINFKLV